MGRKTLNIELDGNISETTSDNNSVSWIFIFEALNQCVINFAGWLLGVYPVWDSLFQEFLVNSVVTPKEIEAFDKIVQIKDAEKKLCVLEIEFSVYKESKV